MTTSYSGWARVELLGHRSRFGQICEVEQFGGKMLRIDIPNPGSPDDPVTEFYGCASIYAITPMSEQMVRDKIGSRDIRPISPLTYQLPSSHDEDD